MKRLKLIVTITLAVMTIAVMTATFNLAILYDNEKNNTMKTVTECAENAIILEMIERMQNSDNTRESFIRLNTFMEFAQQKDGRIAKADTLRTSLVSILRFGLEFPGNKTNADQRKLDSIFHAELKRHDLNPHYASILPSLSKPAIGSPLWKASYRSSPSASPDYDIYVSPMPDRALSGMWGIIIPFMTVICLFSFLTIYLVKTVSRMTTLEQMKDDFTHNMTHELKTPVAVAYSAADSMLRYYDQSDEARNKQFLRIIMQRLSFLSGMIENILSMSMARFKKLNLCLETVMMKPIVEEVAGMIELKAGKPVGISIDIPDNASVQADSLHFGNILSNIMENAIKYSGDSVNISVKADNRSITIADDGIGIDKKNLPYIFDKFYRVATGDRYEAGGYGLGLFYVKQIADLHGWSIDVTSSLGHGTSFSLKFHGNEKRQDIIG